MAMKIFFFIVSVLLTTCLDYTVGYLRRQERMHEPSLEDLLQQDAQLHIQYEITRQQRQALNHANFLEKGDFRGQKLDYHERQLRAPALNHANFLEKGDFRGQKLDYHERQLRAPKLRWIPEQGLELYGNYRYHQPMGQIQLPIWRFPDQLQENHLSPIQRQGSTKWKENLDHQPMGQSQMSIWRFLDQLQGLNARPIQLQDLKNWDYVQYPRREISGRRKKERNAKREENLPYQNQLVIYYLPHEWGVSRRQEQELKKKEVLQRGRKIQDHGKLFWVYGHVKPQESATFGQQGPFLYGENEEEFDFSVYRQRPVQYWKQSEQQEQARGKMVLKPFIWMNLPMVDQTSTKKLPLEKRREKQQQKEHWYNLRRRLNVLNEHPHEQSWLIPPGENVENKQQVKHWPEIILLPKIWNELPQEKQLGYMVKAGQKRGYRPQWSEELHEPKAWNEHQGEQAWLKERGMERKGYRQHKKQPRSDILTEPRASKKFPEKEQPFSTKVNRKSVGDKQKQELPWLEYELHLSNEPQRLNQNYLRQTKNILEDLPRIEHLRLTAQVSETAEDKQEESEMLRKGKSYRHHWWKLLFHPENSNEILNEIPQKENSWSMGLHRKNDEDKQQQERQRLKFEAQSPNKQLKRKHELNERKEKDQQHQERHWFKEKVHGNLTEDEQEEHHQVSSENAIGNTEDDKQREEKIWAKNSTEQSRRNMSEQEEAQNKWLTEQKIENKHSQKELKDVKPIKQDENQENALVQEQLGTDALPRKNEGNKQQQELINADHLFRPKDKVFLPLSPPRRTSRPEILGIF